MNFVVAACQSLFDRDCLLRWREFLLAQAGTGNRDKFERVTHRRVELLSDTFPSWREAEADSAWLKMVGHYTGAGDAFNVGLLAPPFKRQVEHL